MLNIRDWKAFSHGRKNMKSIKTLLLLLLVSAAIATSAPALAHGRVGVYIGGPLFWPGPYYASPYYGYSYPPYYPAYYPPAAVAPAAPPVYVEQGGAQVAPAPAPQHNWWYYCADA